MRTGLVLATQIYYERVGTAQWVEHCYIYIWFTLQVSLALFNHRLSPFLHGLHHSYTSLLLFEQLSLLRAVTKYKKLNAS